MTMFIAVSIIGDTCDIEVVIAVDKRSGLENVSKTSTPVTYNGQRLAYSSGRFSSRMAYVNHKAYIGVDAEGPK